MPELARSVAEALIDPAAVRDLRLWGISDLAEVPTALSACTGVRALAIGSCPITALPAWIGELPELASLDLFLDGLESLPSLAGCPRLRTLKLAFCKRITALPAGCEALETLTIKYTPITAVPAALTQLRSLRLQAISLGAIPSVVRELPHLARLELESCDVTDVPAWLADLPSLRALGLPGNTLDRVAPEVFEHPHLEELDLSRAGWKVTQLPGLSPALRVLRLTAQKVTALPDVLPANLEVLALGGNRIAALPDAIGGLAELRELELQDNPLGELPSTIGGLGKLAKLDLTNCPLRELPPALGELAALTELTIGGTFPPNMGGYHDGLGRRVDFALPPLGKLAHLRILTARDAGLATVPASVAGLAALEILYLGDNQLRELPEELYALPALRVLDVQANSFTQAAYDRLRAWAAERKLATYDGGPVRLPRIERSRRPPKLEGSAAPLTVRVLREVKRLRGAVSSGPPAAPAVVTIRGIAHPVPEAIRAFRDDIAWPAGELGGELRGWDLHIEFCGGDLSEYECTYLHPLVPFAAHATQSYLAFDLADADPTDPTVYYVDHDSQSPDASDWGLLSAFLAALRRKRRKKP